MHIYKSHPLHTHHSLYADDTALLSQCWRPDTTSHRLSHTITNLLKYFTMWKLGLNSHKPKTILFSRRQVIWIGSVGGGWGLTDPIQIPNTFVPRDSAVRCFGLVYSQNFSSPGTCTPSLTKPQAYSITFSPSSTEIQRSVQQINLL